MRIHPTTAGDWAALKAARLAALRDAPTAFGVSHATAAAYSEAQWRERAAGTAGPAFWLAFDDGGDGGDGGGSGGGSGGGGGGGAAVGMIGGGVDRKGEYNLIAMWVAAPYRGSRAAARLVAAVQAHARALGHARVVLDVAPDNARAARFYRRQGFVFLDAWEALASHPEVMVRKMEWHAPAAHDAPNTLAMQDALDTLDTLHAAAR